jgi:hypothetical protein
MPFDILEYREVVYLSTRKCLLTYLFTSHASKRAKSRNVRVFVCCRCKHGKLSTYSNEFTRISYLYVNGRWLPCLDATSGFVVGCDAMSEVCHFNARTAVRQSCRRTRLALSSEAMSQHCQHSQRIIFRGFASHVDETRRSYVLLGDGNAELRHRTRSTCSSFASCTINFCIRKLAL